MISCKCGRNFLGDCQRVSLFSLSQPIHCFYCQRSKWSKDRVCIKRAAQCTIIATTGRQYPGIIYIAIGYTGLCRDILGKFIREISTGIHLSIVGMHNGGLQISVSQGYAVGECLGTALETQVTHILISVLKQDILPICCIVVIRVVRIGNPRLVCHLSVVFPSLYVSFPKLSAVHNVHFSACLYEARCMAKRYLWLHHLKLVSSFCGDNDHAIGCPRTI